MEWGFSLLRFQEAFTRHRSSRTTAPRQQLTTQQKQMPIPCNRGSKSQDDLKLVVLTNAAISPTQQ